VSEVEPFKDSGRGVIVRETTEGSSGVPYIYDFHSGRRLAISVKRICFPDGSEFEGAVIKPDVEKHPSIIPEVRPRRHPREGSGAGGPALISK